MSFLAKIRVVNNTYFNKPFIPAGYQQTKSFNHLIPEQLIVGSKYIIVGTLTPPKGRNAGFFYSAPKNHMFEFIDNAFKSRDQYSLVKLKNDLNDPNCTRPKQNIIDDIKDVMSARKICFIDVVDQAIASSSKYQDEYISRYSLDYESFKKINIHNPNIKIVANSNNAKVRLDEIFNTIGISGIKINMIPQTWRGRNNSFKNKKRLEIGWDKFFN